MKIVIPFQSKLGIISETGVKINNYHFNNYILFSIITIGCKINFG